MRARRQAASPLQLDAEFHCHHPALVMLADYVTEYGFRVGRRQDASEGPACSAPCRRNALR
ncbi:hypothetical protein ACWEK5_16365 [Rhodococcus koreensis]